MHLEDRAKTPTGERQSDGHGSMLVNQEGAPAPEVTVAPPGALPGASSGRIAHGVGDVELTIIEPSRGWVSLKLRELWKYRELLFFLAWRDVKVRYQQTFFGVAWAVVQPLFMVLVSSLFFGRLAKMPSDGVPYPVFSMCAIIPWQLFQYSLGQSSNSVVASQSLIKKVYFPRLVVPLASVLDGLVDFGIALVLLVALMAFYGIAPTINVVFLPLFVAFATIAALSVGIWLSALNVQFRDVRYTVPFLAQFWMFATPVYYSSSIVPERWRWAYGLNPMVGVVDGFRWALIGRQTSLASSAYISVGVVALLFVGGLAYFRRMEASFADVV